MSRSLAHVEEIVAINPIPNADAIEVATVLGWNVVVKKGEFKVGDKVIYIEIDSIVPENPMFEFLRKRDWKVKTIKLRGQLSQGLIIPLDSVKPKYHKVGTDVTNVLGITKKDDSEAPSKPVKRSKFVKWLLRFKFFRWLILKPKKVSKNAFPSWVRKTDETRVQNMGWILEDKKPFVVTEKVDGCSATYTLKGKKFVIASRNRVAAEDSVYYEIANKFNIEHILKKLFVNCNAKDHVTIQGEIIGPKIQGNKYGLEEPNFYVFNVIIDGKRMSTPEADTICTETFGLNFVPVLDTNFILPDAMEEMLVYADGKSCLANILREGVVIRRDDISFKAVSNRFLLKNDE